MYPSLEHYDPAFGDPESYKAVFLNKIEAAKKDLSLAQEKPVEVKEAAVLNAQRALEAAQKDYEEFLAANPGLEKKEEPESVH